VSVPPLVWFSQGVSRYTDLATHVRWARGTADGWQRLDRVSYAKCARTSSPEPAPWESRQRCGTGTSRSRSPAHVGPGRVAERRPRREPGHRGDRGVLRRWGDRRHPQVADAEIAAYFLIVRARKP